MNQERDPLDHKLRRFFVAEMPSVFREPNWAAATPPTVPPAAQVVADASPGRMTLALSLLALAAVGTVLLVRPNGKSQPAATGSDLLKSATADGSKFGLPPVRP